MDARRDPEDLAQLQTGSLCPACGYAVAMPFYDGGLQPLSTIAWPSSPQAARDLPRFPLAFVRCVDCGHVFNQSFNYENVPYSDLPNRMFNRGSFWQAHLTRVQELILARVPLVPRIVEIGCGEGQLLRALSVARRSGCYIGFDPNAGSMNAGSAVEFRRQLFIPEDDLATSKPDMLVMRHVLEHLDKPLAFLQRLSFAADSLGAPTRLFVEVPCIDRALETGRTADFFYEHNSHFTLNSFQRMLGRASVEVECVERSYDDEVLYAIGRIGISSGRSAFARQARDFHAQAVRTRAAIQRQFDDLHASGQSLAIWGGTGKAAAFINAFQVDGERFPLVVDSDPEKAGSYVPSCAQKIRFRDYLLAHPVDIIVIATQWRAREIVAEIEALGIAFRQILIEHQGRLVDYHADAHPYRSCA